MDLRPPRVGANMCIEGMAMRMHRMFTGILASVFAVGCASLPPRSAPPRWLEDVLREAGDRRVEFFDREGRKVERRAPGTAGSVSIYLPDEAGQDNFSFNEQGRIVRHQQSYGDNYGKGIWVDAPAPR